MPPPSPRDRMNLFKGKRLLSKLRGGDYAHAGKTRAIEIAMEPIPKDEKRLILDAGCGRGGTAEFLRTNGWGRVVGIDLDAESIAYAKEKYPSCSFEVCDIMKLNERFSEPQFDLVCMFNVFYNLPDQGEALKVLRKISLDTAKLVVFDYTDLGYNKSEVSNDVFKPINCDIFAKQLQNAGWKNYSFRDLSNEYLGWYESLMGKISAQEREIKQYFGGDWYAETLSVYSGILRELQSGIMGGGVFFADASVRP